MQYHFIPSSVAITTTEKDKYWQECGEIGTFVFCWCKCKMMQQLWKIVWRVLQKLK